MRPNSCGLRTWLMADPQLRSQFKMLNDSQWRQVIQNFVLTTLPELRLSANL